MSKQWINTISKELASSYLSLSTNPRAAGCSLPWLHLAGRAEPLKEGSPGAEQENLHKCFTGGGERGQAVPTEQLRAVGTNQNTRNSSQTSENIQPLMADRKVLFSVCFPLNLKFNSVLHSVIVYPGQANKAWWKAHESRWRDIDLAFRPSELTEQKDKCSQEEKNSPKTSR